MQIFEFSGLILSAFLGPGYQSATMEILGRICCRVLLMVLSSIPGRASYKCCQRS